MTELLKLIELNEIRNVRITCKGCGTAVKLSVERLSHIDKCPECGADFYILRSVLIELKGMLKKRDDVDGFSVHIELREDEK
jgi:rRNA maturation endonuclease Nob1